MKRRRFLALVTGAAIWPLAASRAQPPKKLARIGFLDPGYASAFAPYVDAFRAGFHDLGYAEGENIVIENRWAKNDYSRLPALAKKRVGLNVDVIVTHGYRGYWRLNR